MRPHIVWTIFRKEITEALRDRVTLLVMLGLPILVYPLAILLMTQLMKRHFATEDRRVSNVVVWGVGAAPLRAWLERTNTQLKLEPWTGMPPSLRHELEAGRLQPPVRTNSRPRQLEVRLGLGLGPTLPGAVPEDATLLAAREVVARKQADAVLIVWPGFDAALQAQDQGQVSVFYDSVGASSAQAWSRLAAELADFRQHSVQQRQRARGLPEGFTSVLRVQADNVAPIQRQVGDVFGRVLPILLILLSVAGALYAAVDLTAGEKDRVTMQTLLCAPVRSLEIVAGKFLAVWTISLVSAVANVTGIAFTLGRVAASLHVQVVQFGTLAAVLGLLLPATWTIAALFLAVAVLGRDAKDAGNFLGATAFVVTLPVAVTLLPGVELDAWTALVPLVNLSLLIRALMQGEVQPHLILITLLASITYAGLALVLAARVFGREQILLGGPWSWRSLWRGETRRASSPTPGPVLALFALALTGVFYVGLGLLDKGVLVLVLATEYGCFLLPAVALALARRFPVAQTFSLRRPHWRSVVGCVLIGLTASVAVAGLAFRLFPPPESLEREMREALMLGDPPAPLWVLWLVVGLTPALCEETFFRGLILSGLRRWGPAAAIGISALLFGLAHGSIYRLLPTFALGVLLGYTVWRTGSIYCSMLIHGLNNGLIATLAWSLSAAELEQMDCVPWSWTLAALAVTALGVALLKPPRSVSEIGTYLS
jgi:sodium transport system permease protein